MRFISNRIEGVGEVFKVMNQKIIKKAVLFFILATSITILVTLITYMINPDLKSVAEMADDRLSDQLKEATGIEKVWAFIVGNGFKVPLQMFVLALIPVQFLYLVNIISTSVMAAILFGVIFRLDDRNAFEVIIATMPHYIVEVFAFCLFGAVLFELNQAIRSKISNLFKKDKDRLSLVSTVLNTMKIYGVLTLPLIILAAILETYIADMILSLIQK